MRRKQSPRLAYLPLLQIYLKEGIATGAEFAALPVMGPRFQAVLGARKHFLNEAFLGQASDDDFQSALVEFYQSCVYPPLQTPTVRRRAGFLRHALSHLLHASDSLPEKAPRFLSPDGPYYVAGLGPMFWSALFQSLDPLQQPGYLRGVLRGLERLGLMPKEPGEDAAKTYLRLQMVYQRFLSEQTQISALHLDHFLCLVAGMRGRELWSGVEHLQETLLGCDLEHLIRAERSRLPLRRRIKEQGTAQKTAKANLQQCLNGEGGSGIEEILSTVDLVDNHRSGIDWSCHGPQILLWLKRLWEAEEPFPVLAEYPQTDLDSGAGLRLGATILSLREPKRFFPWRDSLRKGFALLADENPQRLSALEQYSLFQEGVLEFCRSQGLHHLEAPALLAAIARERREAGEQEVIAGRTFAGFCADTFHFLEELEQNNHRDWMNAQRPCYGFVLRQPMLELGQALVDRFVGPILNGEWDLKLETGVRPGQILSSICKNDYGQSVPYQTVMWITFCRKQAEGKKKDVQFFVRLDKRGMSCGIRLGRDVREAGKQFRRNIQEYAELVFRALATSGALPQCQFTSKEDWSEWVEVNNASDLRGWAASKTILAGKFHPADSPLLKGDELVGEIILTFDRLLPAFLCAVMPDPRPMLEKQVGSISQKTFFTVEDFSRRTYLSADWLQRAKDLLGLKRQLILQGVPGTGKTFVAQLLARWLTADRPEAIRLVQFHPAYCYEEFVEGIKARTIEVNGRHEVTYPVEDGVICEFAAQAARTPSQPFVLIIDEINRGNLPRIFGELLYLLEYREQSLILPYSRRQFRLPANLFLIGTMNRADRSVALVDQALRRRFSFLEMPPDSTILAGWLAAHPPAAGKHFAQMVVEVFERLNRQLQKDLGPAFQIGHSYFMVPDLDEVRLQAVWEHQILPLVDEYFAGQPGRAAAYQLEKLLQASWQDSPRRVPPAPASAE